MHFAAEASGDTAAFFSARCSDASCPKRGARLTEAAQAKTRSLGAELERLTLEGSYGCPGCADGPIYVAIVHHSDGKQTRHAFDPMQPEDLPAALGAAAELMNAVTNTFERCESTSLVEIGPECATLNAQDEDAPIGRP